MEEAPAARLVSTPLGGAVTVMMKFVPSPDSNVMAGHVTALFEAEPPPVELMNTTPAGSVFVASAFVATEGPKFVRLTV